MLNVHDTRIWRIVMHYVEVARSKTDMGDVDVLGVVGELVEPWMKPPSNPVTTTLAFSRT